MSTVIHDEWMEAAALNALGDRRRKDKGDLPSLTEGHFHSEWTRAAFLLMQKEKASNGEWMPWEDMINHSAVTDHFEELNNSKTNNPSIKAKVATIYDALERHRQAREFYTVLDDAKDRAATSGVQVGMAILEEHMDAEALRSKRASGSTDALWVARHGRTWLKELVNTKPAPVLPTGFTAFDSVNRGFELGSIVCLGATTGGGKSNMVGQLALNMARASDTKIRIVSLEMNEKQVMLRLMSNISGVPSSEIRGALDAIHTGKQSRGARAKKKRALMEKLAPFEAWADGRISIDSDIAIQHSASLARATHSVLAKADEDGIDVIFVDYIGLLTRDGKEDMWQSMGQSAEAFKRWAMQHDKLVVFAAQTNDHSQPRYARAILEHADYAFTWIKKLDDEGKDPKIIKITQQKCRHGESFSFPLEVDWERHIVRDAPEGAVADEDEVEEGSKENPTDVDEYFADEKGPSTETKVGKQTKTRRVRRKRRAT